MSQAPSSLLFILEGLFSVPPRINAPRYYIKKDPPAPLLYTFGLFNIFLSNNFF